MAAAYQSSNFFIKLGNTNEVVDHADLSEIEAGTITHKRHIEKTTLPRNKDTPITPDERLGPGTALAV